MSVSTFLFDFSSILLVTLFMLSMKILALVFFCTGLSDFGFYQNGSFFLVYFFVCIECKPRTKQFFYTLTLLTMWYISKIYFCNFQFWWILLPNPWLSIIRWFEKKNKFSFHAFRNKSPSYRPSILQALTLNLSQQGNPVFFRFTPFYHTLILFREFRFCVSLCFCGSIIVSKTVHVPTDPINVAKKKKRKNRDKSSHVALYPGKHFLRWIFNVVHSIWIFIHFLTQILLIE